MAPRWCRGHTPAHHHIVPGHPTPVSTLTPGYQGRSCATGTLINDFVILVDREPQASCVETFVPSVPEALYGLSPIPPNLHLRGMEHTPEQGLQVTSVVYDVVLSAFVLPAVLAVARRAEADQAAFA